MRNSEQEHAISSSSNVEEEEEGGEGGKEGSVITNDSGPLLTEELSSSSSSSSSSVTRRGRLSRALRFLRRRSHRRLMREPSVMVRETAAEQIEEQQNEWVHSRPVVILDLLWNFSFILIGLSVLILCMKERPINPLRIWVMGYITQCGVHISCVWFEFRRGQRSLYQRIGWHISPSPSPSIRDSSSPSIRASRDIMQSSISYFEQESAGGDHNRGGHEQAFNDSFSQHVSIAKRIESVNTSFSFVWWVLGFYWTTTGSQSENAPLLFWLCVAFLTFDVFFVVSCILLVCIIGMAVCCCLPCIIAIMYAVAEQKGASEEEINVLPKYKFRCEGFTKTGGDLVVPSNGVMMIVSTASGGAIVERALSAEDAECCICLLSYEDGVELRGLPCGHHFHCACVDRWLKMNSTCPLCKFNVSKSSSLMREDV